MRRAQKNHRLNPATNPRRMYSIPQCAFFSYYRFGNLKLFNIKNKSRRCETTLSGWARILLTKPLERLGIDFHFVVPSDATLSFFSALLISTSVNASFFTAFPSFPPLYLPHLNKTHILSSQYHATCQKEEEQKNRRLYKGKDHWTGHLPGRNHGIGC